MKADRRLQIRPVERLAKRAAEFAVQADIDVGVREPRHVLDMAAERKHHIDVGADALDQPPDFGEVRRHVEGAVDRPDDVDPRLRSRRPAALRFGADLSWAEFAPQPVDRAVGALPLILVDGPRQEALDVGAFRGHAAADHLGDGAGDHDRWQVRIEGRVRAPHRAFGAVAARAPLPKTRDDDRQFVRRQRVGIMQHRRDRQVLATDRTVDDDLQALDRGEGVDRAPVAACAIVVEDEHRAHLLGCAASPSWRVASLLNSGPVASACSSQTAGGVALSDALEEVAHGVKAALVGHGGVDHLRQRTGARDAHTAAAPKSGW